MKECVYGCTSAKINTLKCGHEISSDCLLRQRQKVVSRIDINNNKSVLYIDTITNETSANPTDLGQKWSQPGEPQSVDKRA